MKSVLVPVQSHNPDVQDQQPGYCLVDSREVFACELDDGVPDLGANYLQGYRLGWCGPRGKVKVWASLGAASSVAMALKCDVVTVPRWNGYCLEWSKP